MAVLYGCRLSLKFTREILIKYGTSHRNMATCPYRLEMYVATILPKLASFPSYLKPDVVHIYPNL